MFSLLPPQSWHTRGILLLWDRDSCAESPGRLYRTSVKLTRVSLFPKAGADAQDPAEVLAGGVAAGWPPVEMGTGHSSQGKHTALQQHAVPWPWGWGFTHSWQQGHVGLLGFEEGGWYRQLEKLLPLLLAAWEGTNIPVCLLPRQAEGGHCKMPAVSPVDWKGLLSFFGDTSKNFLH